MVDLFYEHLLESLFDGVYFVDADKRITVWNKGAERITGFSREEVLGSKCSANLLRHIDADGVELCLGGCPLSATLQDGKFRETNLHLHHKQGHRVPVSVRLSAVHGENGGIIGVLEVFTDNSSGQQILRELELLKQEAYLDKLTNIGNRRYADITLQTRIFEYNTHGAQFGVMFLDLDHFKHFNDTYGHKTGDDLLVMVSKTISGMLRRSDIAIRWGGEEFVVILPNSSEKVLRVIAERMRVFIERSFIKTGDRKLALTASIGATLAVPGDTPDSIVQRADCLMYASKTAGRNTVTIG